MSTRILKWAAKLENWFQPKTNMKPKVLRHFRERHISEPAWIFGKGPSLDSYPRDQIGKLRICINESLLRVRQTTCFFGHDELPIRRVARNWPKGCTAVLQHERASWAMQHGIPPEQICVYEKKKNCIDQLAESFKESADSWWLVSLTGTVHSAIHFCSLIGVSRITMVGFDGEGGYAKSLNQSSPPGGGGHSRIRDDSIRLLNLLGMSFEFCQTSVAFSESATPPSVL